MLATFKNPVPLEGLNPDQSVWVPRLAAAVGNETGQVIAQAGDLVNVLFEVYGAECVGIPASCLEFE